jgi:hypothetical protein
MEPIRGINTLIDGVIPAGATGDTQLQASLAFIFSTSSQTNGKQWMTFMWATAMHDRGAIRDGGMPTRLGG